MLTTTNTVPLERQRYSVPVRHRPSMHGCGFATPEPRLCSPPRLPAPRSTKPSRRGTSSSPGTDHAADRAACRCPAPSCLPPLPALLPTAQDGTACSHGWASRGPRWVPFPTKRPLPTGCSQPSPSWDAEAGRPAAPGLEGEVGPWPRQPLGRRAQSPLGWHGFPCRHCLGCASLGSSDTNDTFITKVTIFKRAN